MRPRSQFFRTATPRLADVRRVLTAVAALMTTAAHAQLIELDPQTTSGQRGLAHYVRYVTLDGTVAETLPHALAASETEFRPLERRYIDFGITPEALWLSLGVRNPTAAAGTWRLSLNVRFMTELVVLKRSGGHAETLLVQTPTSTFGERPEPYRLLTVPFSLAAGETAELLVGYRSDGTTTLPLSIETDASFAARYGRDDAFNLACYAAIAFLAILTLVQAMVFRQRSQLSYTVYLCATLLYIAHMDGWTFRFLWPGFPLWNSYAAIPLGLVMATSAILFTRSFAETRISAPLVDKLMLALVALGVLTSTAGYGFAEQQMKGIAYLITSASAATCLGAALLAHRRKQPGMRFFIVGWLGVFTGVALTSIANSFPGIIAPATASLFPKLTILFDALMFYTALGDQARAWRQQRDRAVRGELEALREGQKVADDLHRAERERLEALLLAKTKSQQLAMASHDIRQPLTSLRLALEKAGADGTPLASAHGAQQSLSYLERLADQYSAELGAAEAAPPRQLVTRREFSLRTLLENIELMFRDEAEAKGLRFRCRTLDVAAGGDAISAMRIVSNLVANAIKYTDSGGILIGCRKQGDLVRIVVADTGRGIEHGEFARVLEPGSRGKGAEGTDGQGLGLAIATRLAAQNGYRMDCRSEPGRGSVFSLVLPLLREARNPAAA